MRTSFAATLVAGCAAIAACNSQPEVIFVANGGDFDVLGLTDEQDACNAPDRLGYLTWWDGATLRGCWVRDRGEIRIRFPGMDDRRIPVGDFRRTELAVYRDIGLP